ncbi:MAG: hypothetical protein ACUVV5_08775 [Candidatus Aminicenantales bacterium]
MQSQGLKKAKEIRGAENDKKSFPFAWNEFADQPHNIAPRHERFWHHFRHAGSYLNLVGLNLAVAISSLHLYRRYKKGMHLHPVELSSPFGLACSPLPFPQKSDVVIAGLKETGVRQTLVRLPSWERPALRRHEEFIRGLHQAGFDVTAALLQRRQDVLAPDEWTGFLDDVFSGFSSLCSHFEIGHAWNRTKWGVWDYQEYIDLARPAFVLARRYSCRLVGPAVIDFEFHLYPATLRCLPFDKVSSLLYVDRTGAPENAQFGWTTTKKVALWRAIVDATLKVRRDCWVTEVNWPLQGTGKYSPAPGKPSVTEEQQANFLVRYFVLVLTTGLVQRIYWWQLVAPGYGLVDSRSQTWRKRPSFYAFKTMVALLEGSRFLGKAEDGAAEIFFFERQGEEFAMCWTKKNAVDHAFDRKIARVVSRDGEEISCPADPKIRIEERPCYVFFS